MGSDPDSLGRYHMAFDASGSSAYETQPTAPAILDGSSQIGRFDAVGLPRQCRVLAPEAVGGGAGLVGDRGAGVHARDLLLSLGSLHDGNAGGHPVMAAVLGDQ